MTSVMIHKASSSRPTQRTGFDSAKTVSELFPSDVGPQPVFSGRDTEAQPLRRFVESDKVAASETTRPKQPKERATVEEPVASQGGLLAALQTQVTALEETNNHPHRICGAPATVGSVGHF